MPLVYTRAALDKEFVDVTGVANRRSAGSSQLHVTATNTGNVTLTGVTVVDPLAGADHDIDNVATHLVQTGPGDFEHGRSTASRRKW